MLKHFRHQKTWKRYISLFLIICLFSLLTFSSDLDIQTAKAASMVSNDMSDYNAPDSTNTRALTCWYSNDNNIGKWTSSPEIWYSKLDSSSLFPLALGLFHGSSIWNSALNLSTSVTKTNNSAPIKYYGGTKAQLDALNLFPSVPTTALGLTQITSYTYQTSYSYNGSTKYLYQISSTRGYIVVRSNMAHDNYIKTISHEVGHALGWFGHPSPSQPTWVMEQGILTNTTLSTQEAQHLSQVY